MCVYVFFFWFPFIILIVGNLFLCAYPYTLSKFICFLDGGETLDGDLGNQHFVCIDRTHLHMNRDQYNCLPVR